jgi:hypothetical protein
MLSILCSSEMRLSTAALAVTLPQRQTKAESERLTRSSSYRAARHGTGAEHAEAHPPTHV